MVRWKLFGAAAAAVTLAGCADRPAAPPPVAAQTQPVSEPAKDADDLVAERSKLSPGDRALVDAQEWCAVSTDDRLGSMGPPLKLEVKGKPVFVCCKACKRKAEADPDKTLAKVDELKAKKAAGAPR